MIRIVSAILLACFLFVTGGEASSAPASVRVRDGVAMRQVHTGAVLSMAEQAAEILDSDQSCSVADLVLTVLAERCTLTPAAHAVRHTDVLRTADTPVYIAHRRLLI